MLWAFSLDSRADLLLKAKDLWDRCLFYEAHELLEDLWCTFPKEDKFTRNCLQGLIRLAIAYNHYLNQRKDSALRVLRMVKDQIDHCGYCLGVDFPYILKQVEYSIERLERDLPLETFPELKLSHPHQAP